jgi:hypothetical protein
MLSTYQRLGLPSGILPCGSPTNILYTFLFSPIRDTCPAHFVLLNQRRHLSISLICEAVVEPDPLALTSLTGIFYRP